MRKLSQWLFPPDQVTMTPDGMAITCFGARRFFSVVSIFSAAFVTVFIYIMVKPHSLKPLMLLTCWLSVPLMLTVVELTAQPITLVLSRTRKSLALTKNYFWMFDKTTIRNLSDIKEVFVDSSEVLGADERPTGDITYHPMLVLQNGETERLIPFFSFSLDKAERIVGAIADSLPEGRDSISPRPIKIANSETKTEIEKIQSAERESSNFTFAKLMAAILVAGGLALAWICRDDFISRHEAEIVGAKTQCQYSWNISKDNSETKSSDCTYVPTPERASISVDPKVYHGKSVTVKFTPSDGKEVTASLFLNDREAEQALAVGKTTVVFAPDKPYVVRRPMDRVSSIMIIAVGLLIYWAGSYQYMRKHS